MLDFEPPSRPATQSATADEAPPYPRGIQPPLGNQTIRRQSALQIEMRIHHRNPRGSCAPMHPSLWILRYAFLISSGSKVHSISRIPRESASSRCSRLSRAPSPRLRYARGPPACANADTRAVPPAPVFTPGRDMANPTSDCGSPRDSVSNAPITCPPIFCATRKALRGMMSVSS